MNYITFSDLKINKEPNIYTINFNDAQIDVKDYIGLDAKQAIIDLSLSASANLPYINRLVSDALFSYYVVLSYTNIQLSDEDSVDPVGTYDLMEQSGLIGAIFGSIPEEEINSLVESYEQAIEDANKYRGSVRATIDDLIVKIPQNVEMMNEALADFDPTKFEMLKQFTTAVGGGSLLD